MSFNNLVVCTHKCKRIVQKTELNLIDVGLCVTHRFTSWSTVVNIYSLAESGFALNEPFALTHKYMIYLTT